MFRLQRLILRGLTLPPDEHTLDTLGLREGATLSLVRAGGAPPPPAPPPPSAPSPREPLNGGVLGGSAGSAAGAFGGLGAIGNPQQVNSHT